MKYVALLVVLSIASFAQNNKPRVFITNSQSWEVGGGGGGTTDGFGTAGGGGARPQTAEIVKTFGQRCPAVVTNNIQKNADYVVVLDHEGGKVFYEHDNKVAVFERVTGDSIMSKSTFSLGGSVQAACEAITKHWSDNSGRLTTTRNSVNNGPMPAAAPGSALQSGEHSISVTSNPDGADIEVDGSFVGNTPSAISLAAGDHEVVVKKNGYQEWHRKLKVSGGNVALKAELSKDVASQ